MWKRIALLLPFTAKGKEIHFLCDFCRAATHTFKETLGEKKNWDQFYSSRCREKYAWSRVTALWDGFSLYPKKITPHFPFPHTLNSLELRIIPKEAAELPINLPGGCTIQALSTGTGQLGSSDPYLSQFHQLLGWWQSPEEERLQASAYLLRNLHYVEVPVGGCSCQEHAQPIHIKCDWKYENFHVASWAWNFSS